MKKKLAFWALCAWALAMLAACTGQQTPSSSSQPAKETIELTVWGAEEDEELLQGILDSFQSHYAGEADFLIT